MLCFQREVCKHFRCSNTTARPASCVLPAGASTRGRGLLLPDPSPNPAAVLGLRAAHLPVPFLPSPTEMHPCSQLQDGAAWGHQQVKVLSGSFRLRLTRRGELRPLRGAHRGQGAVGLPRTGGTEHPHRENSPKTPSRRELPPKCPRRGSEASTRSSPQGLAGGGAHSQLVGAAVVELELGADERAARLPRLQLQHHAEPVCGAEQRQSAPWL